MAGNLLNRAKRDAKKYITKGGFEEDIILSNSDGSVVVELTGWVTKHWINFDTDGNPTNSKNAHICLDEETLFNLGYPVRNLNKEIHLFNHKVSTKDSSGELKNYVINEWFPDETLGLIVCILGDFE